MKILRQVFIMVLMATVSAGAAFLPSTDDIPLMDGIELMDTNDVAFDTPAGQILTFDAKTTQTPVAIQQFYKETLTALGWNGVGKNAYERGADSFQISFPSPGKVHFDITLSSEN